MFPDWSCGSLAEGLACYGKQEFFLAHEHWEDAWRPLQGPERSFLQALIQMTAAFHHLRQGNAKGAASLLQRSLRRLEQSPARFGGIDVGPLRAEIFAWLHAIESGTASTPAAFPQLRPADPPE